MPISPLSVAIAPIMLALMAVLTFVASMGTDAPAARTVDRESSRSDPVQVTPSVSIPRPGVSGSIVSGPETADYNHDGTLEAVFGTQRGFYRVADGNVLQYIPTSSDVRDFVHVGDVTGDGIDDVALALGDTTFPNIRVYDSANGDEIWTFRPSQEVFLENLMWTSQQTATFDLAVDDLDGNGSMELFATSGYTLYALDAASGDELWNYRWLDNVWQVVPVEDVNGDGVRDLTVGSQDGYLISVDGSDGSEIWSKQIANQFQAIDEKGKDWKLIDRSTWDIVPMADRPSEAVVTFEDGFARRIDLRSGDVLWEEELLDIPAALISQQYRSRGGNSTSPGDFNFFNMRARTVTDISGDGKQDVIVTTFQGAAGSSSQDGYPGIYAVDAATGNLLWQNTAVDVSTVARLDVVETETGPVLAVPLRNPVYLDMATGVPVGDAPIDLPVMSSNSRQGGAALLAMGDDDYMFASPSGDLLGTSAGEEWSIARTTRSELVRGDFTGDSSEDILVSAGGSISSGFNVEPRARLLYVIDGSTGELAWEYLVPADQFESTGGIAGARAVADLDGDGKHDIIGYMQDVSELNGNEIDSPGKDSRVLLFSGNDGKTIFNGPPVENEYYGIWDLIYRNDPQLISVVQEQVSNRIGGDLENVWLSEEQRRRDEFEQGLFQQWENYRQEQVQNFLAENGAGGSEEELRQQNEVQMDADWSSIEVDRRSEFEGSLFDEAEALRGVGAGESLVSAYEDRRRSDFEAALEADRISTYDQWRADFEQRLLSGEFNSSEGLVEFESSLEAQRFEIEQIWRNEFEASLDQQRVEWIDDQTGGTLAAEVQNEIDNMQRQFADNGNWLQVDKRIVSVDVISYPASESGSAIFVTGGRDVFIIDMDGELLWTRSFSPDVYNTPFGGPQVDMSFGLPVDWQQPVRIVPDRNGDGIDDLRISSSNSVMFANSDATGKELRFVEGQRVIGPSGSDGNGALVEVPDLNGDSRAEVALIHWRDNAPPEANIVDGVTGALLLELDNFDENSVTLAPTADFNGDLSPDVIMFERWVEGRNGPRLRVLASGTGQTIWEFSEYRELFLLNESRNDGPVIPATAVDDMTGDGVPEIALVKHLTWQPGGSIDIYDTRRNELVSSVVTEELDPNSTQEQFWHPGLLARQVGDLNGDGTSELAYVTAFGQGGSDKEYRLGVADIAAGAVIADFMVTGSDLIGLSAPGKFGVAGVSGDLFLLDVNNELSIELPGGSANVSSPVTLEWEGAAPGAFSQVFIDGVEVARTNGEAVELNVRSGEHTVAVRSVDPSGRAVISSVDINVSKSEAAKYIVLAMAMLVVLATLWVPGRRMFERTRVRMAASA